MNEIITISLKAGTIEELARKIQDFQNSNNLISKGSIPFYDSINQEFSVIMFFPKGDTPINLLPCFGEKKVAGETNNSKAISPAKSFKEPTEQLLNKWKNQRVSSKTLNFLKKKHNLSDLELKEIRTQYEAYIFDKNLGESYL